MTERFTLNDLEITIVRSQRRKTLCLEILPEGVIARAPTSLSKRRITEFAQKKQDWLIKHWRRRATSVQKRPITEHTALTILDTPYRLEFIAAKAFSIRRHTDHSNNRIAIYSKQFEPDYLQRKITHWFRQAALEHFTARANLLADTLNVKPTSIKTREYKKRWGSCDANGNVTLNWRLYMAPSAVVDYVIIHELAHLLEFNHSKRFWQIVEIAAPDWRQQKAWLTQNGNRLYSW